MPLELTNFIIDNNLPKDINQWQSDEFIHVFDLDPGYSDSQIWKYSLENNLIIVTKDSDFSTRILHTSPPPRVIHIKQGITGQGNWSHISRNTGKE